MRAALWLLALFGIAVAIALFAGNNQGTVTLFWPPWRVDLSLNLVLVLLFAAFVFLHAVLRALSALFDLPRQAMRWRGQQKERAMHASLLDAMSHLLAGRFIRARKSAQAVLGQERTLEASQRQRHPMERRGRPATPPAGAAPAPAARRPSVQGRQRPHHRPREHDGRRGRHRDQEEK